MKKVQKLIEKMNEMDLDLVLIYSVENSSKPSTYYLSGFTGSFSCLVIAKEKQYIITDSRYFEQAKSQTSFELVEFRGPDFIGTIASVVRQFNPRKIGLEFQRISHATFLKISEKIESEFVPIDQILSEMRMIKDEEEIANIKKAVEISEKALQKTLEIVKEGVSEKDIAAELEYNMKKLGADGTAFETIVLTGPRTSLPHGRPTTRKLGKNEPILFDFGAQVNGYCADITRTFFYGNPSEEFLKVYQTVYEAQTLALEKGSAKLSGKELDAIARERINQSGYGQFFGHGLGHGLGLEVHEEPRVNSLNEKPLPVNSVVTIEPGIYLEGIFGVRIEEDVVVKEDKLERLTTFQRELIILR
ncbi:M24 family metallopeptidase [Pseudothermotoga thermarum]|uniref:Peptidase M24 n=1 Tax=Pseudothermotoga thermarum DSM 5069 TaxID=688269 RepID=F7YVH6_9THEM|nr:Xaa-Pro peptidase family protein [Pseudothermotoga thermarum]AEH51631.1 peptidase M24 [Pseudothermotoga thermarum DSM 5069]